MDLTDEGSFQIVKSKATGVGKEVNIKMTNTKTNIKNNNGSRTNIMQLTIAAMCLALAMLLPFITGQIPSIGNMLCPMHIPVFLCAFFCTWKWAAVVGFSAPLLRFMIAGVPHMPMGIAMCFELATYGIVASVLYKVLPKSKASIYISLISAMILGRIVWGAGRLVIAGVTAMPFTWQLFIGGAFLEAIPGIIIQLILVPIIVMAAEKIK